jgi:hypothetical protein
MILNHQLRQPIETVFAYLTDLQKYQSIHPLITKVETLPGDIYRIHERFLSSPWIFTYTATMRCDDRDKSVEMNAVIMKYIHVNMNFKLIGDQDGTSVIEKITILAPFPFKNLMEPIFRKEHNRLFINLDALQK